MLCNRHRVQEFFVPIPIYLPNIYDLPTPTRNQHQHDERVQLTEASRDTSILSLAGFILLSSSRYRAGRRPSSVDYLSWHLVVSPRLVDLELSY